MSGVVLVKEGVQFTRIAPGGFRLLAAIEHTARELDHDLTVTCACEGHEPTDPHPQGKAYDIRISDLAPQQPHQVLQAVLNDVQIGALDEVTPVSKGFATMHFYGQIEVDHIHVQQRRGVEYP